MEDANPSGGPLFRSPVSATGAPAVQWRKTEHALEAYQAKLALYFKQTMFGVIEWDQNRRVQEWNPAAENIFGYTREEALGRDACDLIVPPELATQITAVFDQLLKQTGGQLSTNENIAKDGRRLTCEWFNTALVDATGIVVGIMSLVRDITSEMHVRSELAASQAELSALIDSTDDFIWTVDPDSFGLRTFNRALQSYFADQLGIKIRFGMRPEDLLPLERAQWWKDAYRQVLRNGSCETDYQVVTMQRDLHLSFNRLIHQGKVFGISVFGKDITERKRVHQALQASEVRYRSLVESSHDWVWEVNAEGAYTFVGPQCRNLLGYDPEEILGKTPFDFMPPGEAQRVARIFGAISAERTSFRLLDNANLHKDGHLVVLETNGVPVFSDTGEFVGYRGMDRDITEQRRSEDALRQSESKFSKIFQLSPTALGLHALVDGRFIDLNNAGVRALGYTREEVIGHTPEELGIWADSEHRRRVRQELETVGRIQDSVQLFRTKSGEVREVLLSAEVVELNGQWCFLSAVVDLTEHRKAEQAVARSEEKFSKAFQSSPVMKCIIRLADQQYIEVNQAFEQQTGYDRKDIIGHTLSQVGLWTDPVELQKLLHLVTEGGFRNVEGVFRTKTGEIRTGLLSGEIIDVSGERCLLAVAEDITARKRAEEALRASEEQFRSIADNLPGVVFQFYARDNGEAGVYFVHERAREILGLSPEPLGSWRERFAACIAPEDQQRWDQSIQQAVASRSPWQCEARFVKPTGEEMYVRGIARPQGRPGELVYYGILLDVTDRKRAEKALRESEARLRLAAEAGRMYAFEWDPATDLMVRSAESVDILGSIPTAAHLGNEFLAQVHPLDREQYVRTFSSVSPDEPSFQITYRFMRSDGPTVWLEERGRGLFDDMGALLRTIGMTADVTARKEAEQDLRELSGRMINVLEEERKRVARELHDGVSQALAIVSIELAQAAQKVSSTDLGKKLDKAYGKLGDVLSDIAHISHQLHPATLKHLGFTAAIRDLCREISESHDIEIAFTHANVPESLSPDTALCLYRVAQEALQNITKHSRSKTASVELAGDSQELCLCVCDVGIGFDLESVRHGLGLVSMRERLRLVGGALRISSNAPSGTRIEAFVPLRR